MDKDKVLNKIYDYIDDHRDDMLKILKEYINFRSVNTEQVLGGETTEMVACQQWVSQELEKTDYFSKVDYNEKAKGRPNVVGVRKGNGNGRSLHFNAHTDVVTVSQEQAAQWSMLSPFDGGVKDGKAWGRGASDMKAVGTAMLHAAKTLAAHDVQLKADLLLSFVNGEESGRADISVFILLDRGYTSDFSIMAKPTNPEHI